MVTNEIKAEEIVSYTKSLVNKVEDYLLHLKELQTAEALYKFILSDFVALSNFYIALCDQVGIPNAPVDTLNLKEEYLLNYALAEPFKDLALLNRDVLLELQIAKNKLLEDVVTEVAVIAHYNKSKDILGQATQAFLENIEHKRTAIYKSEIKGKKTINKIKHQNNPWGIYKGQFAIITQQIKEIKASASLMSKTIKIFKDINKHNDTFLFSIKEEIELLKTQMGVAIKYLKDLSDPSQITEITNFIDSTNVITKFKDLQESYMGTIEQKIKMLQNSTVPVSTEDGVLHMRKIDFNKTVEKWIDFEILPLLIDLMENRDNMVSYFKHNLLNLKTGLVVEKNNASIESVSSQLQTVKNAHSTISTNAEKIDGIIVDINKKYEDQFKATHIYSKKDILEVSIQSSISQFTTDQTTLLTAIKKRWSGRFSKFNSKYEPNALFNTQNKIESAVASINYRMNKEEDAHYDTLFLNKYFMGDVFLLPRVEQEKDILNSIEQWKNGFNKAILVTGDGLSGKTTFVNHIAHKYFAKHSVVLEKNSTITYNGRKFITTTDLGEALQQIKKSISSTPSVLIIDDLELWKDEKNTLLNNIRALIQFIESESDEIMVIVTTSEQMRDHLNKRLRFSDIFTSTANLNKAKFEEIYKAVLIRHGASHKTLVSKDGQEFTTSQIEQQVQKLAKALDYNIGEVLQAWTYGTTMMGDNKVVYHQEYFPFKDFFTPEEIIILKYVLLYKQINELTLKSYVGSRYSSVYQSALKRLVNTKILLRTENGLLQLNSVLAKDIKQLLIYKSILN